MMIWTVVELEMCSYLLCWDNTHDLELAGELIMKHIKPSNHIGLALVNVSYLIVHRTAWNQLILTNKPFLEDAPPNVT